MLTDIGALAVIRGQRDWRLSNHRTPEIESISPKIVANSDEKKIKKYFENFFKKIEFKTFMKLVSRKLLTNIFQSFVQCLQLPETNLLAFASMACGRNEQHGRKFFKTRKKNAKTTKNG